MARAELGECTEKVAPTRRNYQVLRSDASPQGVNCIYLLRRGSHGFAGLAPHSGRPSLPRSFVPCSGAGRLLFHHNQAQRPLDNRASIGKTRPHVNSIPFDIIDSFCQQAFWGSETAGGTLISAIILRAIGGCEAPEPFLGPASKPRITHVFYRMGR